MRSGKRRACAQRARKAGSVCAAALFAFALVGACAQALTKAQDNTKKTTGAADAASVVGAWHATANGLRVATISIVPDGERLAGAFVGYDYDRKLDMSKPVEGPPPKVAIRTGSLLSDARLEGDTLTFRMTLRPPSPPPGRPAAFEVTGEIKFHGGDSAELKLSAPHKPEPMVLKLTRE